MPIDPAALPDDVNALKRINGEMAQDAVTARTEIEKLRFQLVRLKRAQFDQSSEKIDRTVAQLAIETAKLNGIAPEAYLRNVPAPIADHPIKRITELLPWHLLATQDVATIAA